MEDLPEKTGEAAQARALFSKAKAQMAELEKAIPKAPAACSAFVRRAARPAAACADKAGAVAVLSSAMNEADPGKRDAALAGAEACAALPAGLARALRAELAPAECADALVEPYLAAASR